MQPLTPVTPYSLLSTLTKPFLDPISAEGHSWYILDLNVYSWNNSEKIVKLIVIHYVFRHGTITKQNTKRHFRFFCVSNLSLVVASLNCNYLLGYYWCILIYFPSHTDGIKIHSWSPKSAYVSWWKGRKKEVEENIQLNYEFIYDSTFDRTTIFLSGYLLC